VVNAHLGVVRLHGFWRFIEKGHGLVNGVKVGVGRGRGSGRGDQGHRTRDLRLQRHAEQHPGGQILVAYVYLDPANPPSTVMLEWSDGVWHRAYWGADNLASLGPRTFAGPRRKTLGSRELRTCTRADARRKTRVGLRLQLRNRNFARSRP
jgi:hypothetical protein